MNAQTNSAGAPDLSIRARPPSPKRLSRNVLLAGALAAGAVIAWALIGGLSDQRSRRATSETQAVASNSGPPETIQKASSDYDPAALQAPKDMLWGDHPPPKESEAEALEPPVDKSWMNAPAPATPRTPDPQIVARTAPILFSEKREARARAASGVEAVPAISAGQRSVFLNSQRVASDERLPTTLTPPRSPFELQAGTVIPAALLTELNSDLPGRVIAQVTAPVYDSVSGEHLLIPQGARLIGTYDSATTHGDKRIMLAVNSIIVPN